MVISRKKQLNYVLNLDYPIIGNKVQIDLDDTDSITFSRFVSKKAVVMCANRLEYILANNPDNFDLDIELSNLHETLRFAEKNLKVAGGIEEWNGNTAWLCVNSFGMELMFASKPKKIDDGFVGEISAVFYHVFPKMPRYKVGDKVVQFHLETCDNIMLIETDKLNKTERGDNGYGSSDKK